MSEGQFSVDGNGQPAGRHNDRIFAHEGPVVVRPAPALPEGQLSVRSSLQRYSDEIVKALHGPDSSGFVLGLVGPWGSGKTSAMLTLLDLIEERLRKDLPPGLEVRPEPSPQEPLARVLKVTDFQETPQFPVTSSVLRAPLSRRQGQPDDARLALAHAILWGLPPQTQSAIAEWLGFKPEQDIDGLAGRLRIERFLRQELRRQAATGTEVEQWIRDARATWLSSETGTAAKAKVFLQKNVHLTMLDDLDRAPLAYSAQILNAMRFWVDTDGMFFVVAATADYLERAAQLANATDAGQEPPRDPTRQAVQKFVHHELHMPGLFSTAAEVAAYWKQLLPADGPQNKGLSLLGEALDRFSEHPSGAPLGLLIPLLSPQVVEPSRPTTPLPREAKRNYNSLVGEVSSLIEAAGVEEFKRNVASLAWRDAWLEFVHPALTETGPDDRPGPATIALTTALDLAERAMPNSLDELPAAIFRLEQLAKEARLDLTGIPPTLLLYLAADPPLRMPQVNWPYRRSIGFDTRLGRYGRESTFGNSPSSTDTGLLSTSGPSIEEEQTEQANDAPLTAGGGFTIKNRRQEEAIENNALSLLATAKAGDLEASRRYTEQLILLMESLSDPTEAEDAAPTIGNAAIRVESMDPQLAWDIHRIAYLADPEHPNIRMNLSDFLLDYARGEDAWAEVERHLDWIGEHAPEHKPERQLLLRSRLARARGDEALGRELLAQLLTLARRPDASFEQMAVALTLLSDLKEREQMETLVRGRLSLRLPQDQGHDTYRFLRWLGDQMIADDGEVEARGLDILRHLAVMAFCPDINDLAAVLNNLALIYNNRGGPVHEELAGMLWRHALEIDPGDTKLRQAYARYLEDREPDNARRLQLGQMPSIPAPSSDDVRRLVRLLPAHLSEGPWWWEEYVPPRPRVGYPELTAPPAGPPAPAGSEG